MNLKLIRKEFTEISTIGELYVNDQFCCYILEDKERGLISTMPLTEIQSKKVYGKTCIPYGKYEIAITFSNKYQKYLPLLISVPGYEGIRIHPGNTEVDSLGCLLPGQTKGKDLVGSSKIAFENLFKKLKAVEKKEKMWIEITK